MSILQLDDAKAHLRVTIGDDDVLIQNQINAAEAWLGQYLGTPLTQIVDGAAEGSASATFTQSGSNNFAVGDVVTIGRVSYVFVSALTDDANQVLVGADFPTSAANLVAAVNAGSGYGVAYSDGTVANPYATAAYGSALVFTTIQSGLAGSKIASIYTPAGTAAGNFGGATFSGGTLPDPILEAERQLVSFLYDNRAAAVVGNTITVTAMTPGFYDLLAPYRWYVF